jgi:ribosomal protein S18 acetylase RimI-like enzyme
MPPTSSITVRTADVNDLDRVLPLFGAYLEFYRRRRDPGRERGFLRDRLQRGECTVFVAESDGRTVGFTLLYPLYSSLSQRRIWLLNDLYVLPEFRRHGVASQLLARAQSWGVETDADYLTLETAHDNPAQHLYEARGWKRDEQFLHYELTV